jgi:preprotein translocase subunit SecB
VIVAVSVFQDEQSAPFKVRLVYEGYFRVEEGKPIEGLRQYAHYNAVASMMPYLRETLSSLTTRAAFLPLILPPINVQELVDMQVEVDEGA